MMEYDHGKRITPHYFEMSPLERAISGFEEKAKKHYSSAKVVPANETPEQRQKREKELALALSHLRLERLKVRTEIQVQCRLEEYRKSAASATECEWEEMQEAQAIMAKEKHHPCGRLADFMRADGHPQPGPRFSAHHIVPGRGKTRLAAESRVDLHFHGIGINDPDNGVWMPMTRSDKGHWAYKHAAAHSEIHTFNYEIWVHRHTQNLDHAQALRDNLLRIRTHLKNGTQPAQVTARPDQAWNGK